MATASEKAKCKQKKRYGSDHEAQQAAKLIYAKLSKSLRVYHCPVCSGYHLTSSARR